VLLWLYIGSTLTTLDGKHTFLEKLVLGGEILIAIGLGLYIGRRAQREF
jgi:hypothetical protein